MTDDRDALLKRIHDLESQLAQGNTGPATPPSSPASPETPMEVAPLQDGESTLRRLVQRIAMILQAEKIVVMFFDQEQGELIAIPPSHGVEIEKLNLFRVRATQGVSGEVFRSGEPLLFHDAPNDNRTKKDL
ncbi:MAG: GAF domain-containing protein, partial [Fimbriimonadaceae bacterium]